MPYNILMEFVYFFKHDIHVPLKDVENKSVKSFKKWERRKLQIREGNMMSQQFKIRKQCPLSNCGK